MLSTPATSVINGRCTGTAPAARESVSRSAVLGNAGFDGVNRDNNGFVHHPTNDSRRFALDSYCGLTLLGVCDRTTPALASEVAQLAAALSSFEDARARLQQMGVSMSIRRIANVAYHFVGAARNRQAVDSMGIEGSLAGKRVVISTDGGRLRVRKNKRGQKTKKGRSRYHTDWREPKLLVIYVGGREGTDRPGVRPGHRRHAPGPRRSVPAPGILSARVEGPRGQGRPTRGTRASPCSATRTSPST